MVPGSVIAGHGYRVAIDFPHDRGDLTEVAEHRHTEFLRVPDVPSGDAGPDDPHATCRFSFQALAQVLRGRPTANDDHTPYVYSRALPPMQLSAGEKACNQAQCRRKWGGHYRKLQEGFRAKQSRPEGPDENKTHAGSDDGSHLVASDPDAPTVISPSCGDCKRPDDGAEQRHRDNQWLLRTKSGAVQRRDGHGHGADEHVEQG